MPGLDTVRSPGDPVFDAYVARRYDETIDRLRGAGIERVLWVACPHQSRTVGTAGMPEQYLSAREPWRVDRINGIVAELAGARDDVDIIDLATWVERRVDDATLRPDGSHFEWEHDTGVAAEVTRLVDEALRRADGPPAVLDDFLPLSSIDAREP